MNENPITALAETKDERLTNADIITVHSILDVENHLGDIIEQVNIFCTEIEAIEPSKADVKEYRKARTKFRKMKQSFEDEVTAIRTSLTAGLIDFEADAKTIKKRLAETDGIMKANLDRLTAKEAETLSDPSKIVLNGINVKTVTYTINATNEQITALEAFLEHNKITFERN